MEVDSSGVIKASGNLDEFAKKAKESEKETKSLDNVLDKFSLTSVAAGAGCLALVNGITKVIKAMSNFTKASLEAYAELEMVRTNLQIVVGDMAIATNTFEDLKEMALKTPFSLSGLADAATQLLQTGTAADKLLETLRMLGDVSSGDQEKFNRIILNYSQIQSMGQTTSMDIKQFAMAGLPIYEMLAKLGVQGNATAEQITEAFQMMAGEGGKFYNGMEIQAQTLQGRVQALKGVWTDFMSTFAESSGLGTLWKSILVSITEELQNQIELMDSSHLARNKRVESGTASNEDIRIAYLEKIRGLEEELNDLSSKREQFYNSSATYTQGAREQYLISLGSAIMERAEQLTHYKNLLQELNELEERNAKNAETSNLVNQYNKEYQSSYSNVLEMFSKTEQAKREELLETLEMLEKAKELREWELKENEKTGLFSAEQKKEDERYLMMIEEVIKSITEELADLNKGAGKGILTWREYWEQVTGSSAQGKSGAEAASDYLASFEIRRQKALGLAEELNLSIDDVNEKFLKELQTNLDKLLSKQGLDEDFTLLDDSITALIYEYNVLAKLLKKETKTLEEYNTLIELLNAKYREQLENEEYSKAVGTGSLMAVTNAAKGTDVGVFADSYVQSGSIEVALVETLVASIVKVVGGLEGLELILNPVTTLLESFEPALKTVALLLFYIQMPLRLLGKGIEWLNELFFGKLADNWDELVDSQKEEIEKLKDLTSQYEKLKDAIKEQEEYYLRKKTELNAQTEISNITRNVNDMILTPQGNFSTHPDDYIIATKNPQSLGGGVVVNVKVENTASDSVNANVTQTRSANGEQELIVMISKKVASDVATGANGWDSALSARNQRLQGRMISL